MIAEYKEKVKAEYFIRLESGGLSSNLTDLSPAKIKAECMLIYNLRGNADDNNVLQDYFGLPDERSNYSNAIRRLDIDRYRPLVSYLRGANQDPHLKHIELLAWLMNYQPRPYSVALPPPPPPDPPGGSDSEETTSPQAHGLSLKELWTNQKIRWALLETMIVIVCVGLAYRNTRDGGDTGLEKQCMVWTTDRYEPIPCDQKPFNKISFALDTFQVHNFRLITQPDTLTAYSVGRVFYGTVNGKPQVFTSMGKHPITGHYLKPLSFWILRKYFGKTVN